MHRGLVLAALLPTCIVASCAKANGDLEMGMFGTTSAGVQQEMRKQADTAQRQDSPGAGEEEDGTRRAYRAEIQSRLNVRGNHGVDLASHKANPSESRTLHEAAVPPLGATGDVDVESSVTQADALVKDTDPATDVRVTGTIGLQRGEITTVPAEQPGQKLPDSANGQHELAAVQTAAGAKTVAAVESSANAVMNAMISEAVCSNDERKLQSVKAIIDAGALDKNAAIAAVDASIRMCATASETPRTFLLSLAGNDISIPYWMDLSGYRQGKAGDLRFGHVPLEREGSFRLLVTGTYPQMVMTTSFGTSDQTYFKDDAAFARLAAAAVNKRDCLGFTPLFYASSMENFDFLKWLLDNGADPDMPVPFATNGPGLPVEAVGQSDSGGRAFAQYECADNGPSAALMESYRTNDELVPVWTYALRQINAAPGKANFKIIAEMLAKVSSVPATTLADVIDSKSWDIDVNAEEDVAMIKLLAEKGADLNAPLRDGRRPMASWIQQGINPESLRQLMFIGARL